MTYITSGTSSTPQNWFSQVGKAVAAFMRDTSDRGLAVTESPWPANDRHQEK
ncbi:hypothetical protein [Paracoccus saliphilus]|uniref:Uncharacterized protein n=1 Tax=Paracoccus saliphilus TaxID=405559 RepID=A0AA45W6V6_9RHOB|nr:hypothetical protein [Paracoccus saliphilus]WCR03795.1 hypothetical protein JHX88_03245 [Paracoccus saliphilus]SIT04739.1 hypothetical protein SAMN05421772_11432 [Paracoccus saliphilus]